MKDFRGLQGASWRFLKKPRPIPSGLGDWVFVGGASLNAGCEEPIAAGTATEITFDRPIVDESGVAELLYRVIPVGR